MAARRKPERKSTPPESTARKRPHRRQRLCKHFAALARRRSCADSLFVLQRECFRGVDSGSPQKISETRIGTERTKFGTEHIAIKSAGMVLDRAIKPT